MQTKYITLDLTQIKLADEGQFSGYASVFNGKDSYGDTIVPGAYKETLKRRKRPYQMLFGHNPGKVIGKWIKAVEDDKGLFVTGELTPGHSIAKDVHASLKHGTLDGLSIGYEAKDYEPTEDGRVLKEIELFEISVVSMPADEAARIDLGSVKSELEGVKTLQDCERFLRESVNLSRSAAVVVVNRIKSIANQSESEEVTELRERVKGLQDRLIRSQADLLLARHQLPHFLKVTK